MGAFILEGNDYNDYLQDITDLDNWLLAKPLLLVGDFEGLYSKRVLKIGLLIILFSLLYDGRLDIEQT